MKIHIVGICGTFMGGVALLAKEAGVTVTGSDANVYPPMSTLLASHNIEVRQGYHAQHIDDNTDMIVIGNTMKRGVDIIEHIINGTIPFTSGPQWLYENVLRKRWVIAVAGTHGKTTTSSMVAWILEYAGMNPGFLIGGVPENFGLSARFGSEPFFVVEADEYDTCFFDKRSKFVHYHPSTVILNNLEYDHADIFPDLEAIKTQFHHLMRIVPGKGLVVHNADETNLDDVLERGSWTPQESFSATSDSVADWTTEYIKADGSQFKVYFRGEYQGEVNWSSMGEHNVSNAIAAIAAARHAGVPSEQAIAALNEFKGVKRRMQIRGKVNDITVYDDFAHHPTAITTTLNGLRKNVGSQRIFAILEPRSNTMKMGIHQNTLAKSLTAADEVLFFQPEGIKWDLQPLADGLNTQNSKAQVKFSIDDIIDYVVTHAQANDHILVMSNGGFGNIHDKLLAALKAV